MKFGQVFETVKKLKMDYFVTKSHYQYCFSCRKSVLDLKRQKINKVMNVPCSYFVNQTKFLNRGDNPMSKMYIELFQVPKELFTKKSLYDKAKLMCELSYGQIEDTYWAFI